MTSLEQIELIFTNAIEKIKIIEWQGRKVSAHFPLYIILSMKLEMKVICPCN